MQANRRHMATQANKRSDEKKANEKKKANKKENIFVLLQNALEVGEMKMRRKWQIM